MAKYKNYFSINLNTDFTMQSNREHSYFKYLDFDRVLTKEETECIFKANRYIISLPSDIVKNIEDYELKNFVIRKFPKSSHLLKDLTLEQYELILSISNPKIFQNFDYIPVEIQQKLVNNALSNIKFINNPDITIQKFVVTKNHSFIKYIRNPAFEVQKQALIDDIRLMFVIKNLSEEVLKEVIRLDPVSIDLLPNPSYKICLEAVSNYGLALSCVPEIFRNKKICFTAIKKDIQATKYVKNFDKEIIDYISNTDLSFLRFVDFRYLINNVDELNNTSEKILEYFFNSELMDYFDMNNISKFNKRVKKIFMESKI